MEENNAPGGIIDAHTHIFPVKLALRAADRVVSYYNLTREGDGTAQALIKGGEGLGSVRYVISSAALKPEHVVNGNNFLLSEAKREKRFIPLCSFHPDMELSAGIGELERVKAEGARGIKLHSDFQGFAIDAEKAFPFYEACQALGLPVLFHVGDENSDISSPRRVYNVINRLPALKVIAAHMGGYRMWEEAEEFLIGTPVYTDTSDALIGLTPERIYKMIKKHGADRVMFGSDYPLCLTRTAFDAINAIPFTNEEKRLIFRENAERIYLTD